MSLKKLKLVESLGAVAQTPTERARSSFLARVMEQQEMAKTMDAGREFFRQIKKRQKDEATGKMKTQTLDKEVKPWFKQQGGKYFIEVRSGAQRLVIANGKSTIAAGSTLGEVGETLGLLADAAKAGELDAQLLEIAKKRPQRKKK